MRPGTQQIYDLPDQPIPGDFAIFHCGSVLSDKTARLLTSHTTATVLVCELNRTRSKEVKEAIEVVKRLKGTVLGVITVESGGGLPKFMRVRVPRKKSDKEETNTDITNRDTTVA
jgi:Mrp family chromosome partitioning ATPase